MKAITMIPIAEAIPSKEIFAHMSGLSFIASSAVAEYMDLEYFYNHSYSKQASPLLEQLSSLTWASGQMETKLANIITNRFSAKCEGLFRQYASLATLNLLKNIDVLKETEYGHEIGVEGSDTLTKSGSETTTFGGTETRTESFPVARKSTRELSGGYSDTDTTATTRTGKQTVANKGDTLSSVYGFNSSTAVPSSKTGPVDQTGILEETTFGESGLVDSNSGAVTRLYNQYKEETTESGSRQTTTSYGENGKTETLSFTDRGDSREYDSTTTHSGTDSITESGYRLQSLVDEYIKLFTNGSLFDFLAIVYNDCDEVLASPYYV